MKKLMILSIFALTMTACKNDKKVEVTNETTTETPAIVETTTTELEPGCYGYNKNGDMVKMEITKVGKEVAGNLDIQYKEKDANKGTFVGKVTGDKLLATYTFNSEGTTSTREIAYQIKDGQLIEGYGDAIDDGTKFKDVNTLQYTSTMPLVKMDCAK